MGSRQESPAWGAYALSALLGSALTFVAIELHHRQSSSSRSAVHATPPSQMLAPEGDEDKKQNGNVDEKNIACDNIDEDTSSAPQDRQMRCTKCEQITNTRVNTNENGNNILNHHVRHARISRTSFNGSFAEVDGENRNSHAFASTMHSSTSNTEWPDRQPRGNSHPQEDDHYATTNGTAVHVLSEALFDDEAVREYRDFDAAVVSKLKTLDESKLLLHRTRAVSALASRLMAAPDEEACYEVASKLLVPLFDVDRCAYALKKDADHIIVKGVTVKKRQHATKLGLDGAEKTGSVVKPIKDTMVAVCASTLTQQYCPRTSQSTLPAQVMMHSIGINSVLATPIVVNGNKFAGCIIISMTKEDAFMEYDRILIQDIASMLGANIYAKRLRKTSENSNRISREMLHSMIPAKVINKIEVFWDEKSVEYISRRSSKASSIGRDSIHDSVSDDINLESSTNNYGKCGSATRKEGPENKLKRCRSVSKKINFLNTMNHLGEGNDADDAAIIVDTSAMEIETVGRALYAENVPDVVVIFTDIVGFSKMALDMKPLEVVDMLQSLFSRFDALCDIHGVTKLETIGDAYICTTNLFDEDQFGGNTVDAACAALSMAKDMVLATQEVLLPSRSKHGLFRTLEIRVGIHIGEVTCGVLGERLPKFTVFGHNVNLAARMEQTSKPNMLRVTEDFRRLVSNVEDDWDEYEVVAMKNMGEIGTYILDPLDRCFGDIETPSF